MSGGAAAVRSGGGGAPCRWQYAFISLLIGIVFFILKKSSLPSGDTTLKLSFRCGAFLR